MVVSHDNFFVNRVAEHLFVFEGDGVVRDFEGSILFSFLLSLFSFSLPLLPPFSLAFLLSYIVLFFSFCLPLAITIKDPTLTI